LINPNEEETAMTHQFFSCPKVLQRLHAGPLGDYIDGFAQTLVAKGYRRSTATHKIRIVAGFSLWLDHQGLSVKDLDEEKTDGFLSYQGRRGRVFRIEPPTLRQFLEHLYEMGAIVLPSEVVDDGERGRLERSFAQYLAQERGLTQATLDSYLPVVHSFLSERFANNDVVLDELIPQDIAQFILRKARTASPSRTHLMATALRSFLGFLYLRGETAVDLSGSLPGVGSWRVSELPKFIDPEQVEAILQSCDQCTPTGRRDYAILLLLARLGLRAGEVVHMLLDDIHWETGELTVRGKSVREDRLPLPQDVGEALVSYLLHGRPRCRSRRVFIRTLAPHKGFSSSVAICDVVRRALARAGLDLHYKGSHLLRHSLATQMLRQGVSLAEIGEVLRHQLLHTTEIYAKVDIEALRALAQPWPGGEA
jgi:site-specific recombinase XerD